ncbi:MAG: tetratricopeptide repeat protein [Acidobacteriota bacterium]
MLSQRFLLSRRPASLFMAALLLVFLVCSQCGPGPAGGPVLVYSFTNDTGNPQLDIWDPELTDLLARSMWQAESPVVWSPLRSFSFRQGHLDLDRAGLLEAAAQAGADVVIFGRVAREAGGYLLSAELSDAGKGTWHDSVQVRVKGPANLSQGVDSLRDAIWRAMGTSASTPVRPVDELTTANDAALGEFITGEVLYSQEKFLAARDHFTRAAKADINFSLAHYRKATARMQYTLVSTPQLKSDISIAWSKRKHAAERDQLAIEAMRALIFNDFEQADTFYQEVRRRWPGDQELAFFHGAALSRLKRTADAMEVFENAAACGPRFIPAWQGLAQSAFLVGKWDRAREAVDAGLAINPEDPILLETDVRLDLFSGDYQAADRKLSDALRFWNYPSFREEQARLLLLQGDPVGALRSIEGLESSFLEAVAELYRGGASLSQAHLDQMIGPLLAQRRGLPAAAALWFSGMIFERNDMADFAIKQYTKAFSFYPQFMENMAAMGLLYARQGKEKDARLILGELEEAAKKYKWSPHWKDYALLLEGTLSRIDGDFDRAIELLDRARAKLRFIEGIGFFSDGPLFAESAARAYLDQGDLAAAQKLFEQITEMHAARLAWPWIWVEAHMNLAELAARDNRMEEAEHQASIVRTYWGAMQGHSQRMVDEALQRLSRLTPEA